MSSGSLKDTVKAITIAFSTELPLPLPDKLQQAIEAFLEKHQKIDDSDSERLHDELLAVYHKYVEPSTEKLGAFICLLKLLQPAITGEKRLQDWWTLVIRPAVDAIGQKRKTIEEAKEFLLANLIYDADDDPEGERSRLSKRFSTQLFDVYLARTKIPLGETEVASVEDECIAGDIEAILVAFGRKNPKQLLLQVDQLLVKVDCRLQGLSFLSSFVRLQPPHLHLVLETPLIEHLLNCLLIDMSATVADLALPILIMFLPHITTTLVDILPKLFLVYARVLCWDLHEYDKAEHRAEISSEKLNQTHLVPAYSSDETWKQLAPSADAVESVTPRPTYLFTFLYGLFPLNLMEFIRKPRKYLKAKNYPDADVLDLNQSMIRTRTETHRNVHILHRNFFTTTPEDELSDSKWLKADPADLVSECLGLSMTVSIPPEEPGSPPTTTLPDSPKMPRKQRSNPTGLLATIEDDGQANAATPLNNGRPNSWRNNTSTMATLQSSNTNYSTDTALSPQRSSSKGSYTDSAAHSTITSPGTVDEQYESRIVEDEETLGRRAFSSAKPAPTPPRTSSLSPNTTQPLRYHASAHALSRTPLPHSSFPSDQSQSIAVLHREIMLLKNSLNFERYLKQQHLAHIGHLQRKHMSDATAESEAQNLFNTNRTLKARLAKANELYTQLKKEMQTSRSQSKKYEEQLSAKLKAYREEEKQWKADMEALQHDYRALKQESDRLRALIIEADAQEQHSQQRIIAFQRELEELAALREQLHAAELRVRELEQRELQHGHLREAHDTLNHELETIKLELASRDAETERTKQSHKRELAALRTRLQPATAASATAAAQQPPAPIQQLIDAALAASNAKLEQLRRSHARLQHRYAELELRLDGLRASGPVAGGVRRPHAFPDSPVFDEDAVVPASAQSAAAFKKPAGAGGPAAGADRREKGKEKERKEGKGGGVRGLRGIM